MEYTHEDLCNCNETDHLPVDFQRRQPPWNKPYFPKYAGLYPYMKNWQYFTNIIGNLTKNNQLKMSALDIAPILTPVKSYENYLASYPKQFKFTMAQHMWSSGQEAGSKDKFSKIYPKRAPNFLSKINYFGDLLGEHLELVMEVMYHSILRAAPLRENWSENSVYQGALKEALIFQQRKHDDFYTIKMMDFISNASFSYMPIHGRKYQTGNDFINAGDPDLQDYFGIVETRYNLSQPLNFSISPESLNRADEHLESLRLKYQHRQFILMCKIGENLEESCENQFQAVLTNKGICYAYNAGNFQSNLQDTEYNTYFNNIFGTPHINSNNPTRFLETGFKMSLILDSHQTSVSGYEQGHFEIAINQRSDAMSMLRNTINVEIGQRTLIKANAIVQYNSTMDFAGLSKEVRQCYQSNEGSDKLNIFK